MSVELAGRIAADLTRVFEEFDELERAARRVVDSVDPLTPKEWAFGTPASIREAIIALEDVLSRAEAFRRMKQ